MRIVCQNRREKRSHPILDCLLVFWARRRGSEERLMPACTVVLGGYQATRQRCVTGQGRWEDEQKCGQRIRQDEGRRHDCLTSSLLQISSCDGARKYRRRKASQFIYTPLEAAEMEKAWEWSCHQRIVLPRAHCVSRRGQMWTQKVHVCHWERWSHCTNIPFDDT